MSSIAPTNWPKVFESVEVNNRAELSKEPKYTTYDCDKIDGSTSACITDGELDFHYLFGTKRVPHQEVYRDIILGNIVLSSRINLKSLGASFARTSWGRSYTFNSSGYPSQDLLDIYKRMVRNSATGSMNVSTEAAYNGSSCCFVPQCALTVSLSTTDGTMGDHELYEVDEKHGDCGFHKSLCKSGTVTISPTYNSVVLVAFVGILAGIGNGLKNIDTKARKSTVKVTPLLLSKLISDVLRSDKHTPARFSLPFFKDWQQNVTLNQVLQLIHNTQFSLNELKIVLFLICGSLIVCIGSTGLPASSIFPKTYSNYSQESS